MYTVGYKIKAVTVGGRTAEQRLPGVSAMT